MKASELPARLALCGLGLLAVLQMGADLAGLAGLKAVAAATGASPAPRVFSAVRGLETYSTRFALEWRAADGSEQRLALTPESAARLRGPYNRRNVYGAALAYGPVLAADARTRPMLSAVLAHGLCAPGPLIQELLPGERGARALRIRYEPLRAGALGDLPLTIEVDCP